MPRLSRSLVAIVHILERLVKLVIIADSGVCVVFARPDLRWSALVAIRLVLWKIKVIFDRRSVIDQRVTWSIPSTETEIKTSHESDGLVNNTHLLVLPERTKLMSAQHP